MNILMIRLSALGDVVRTLPALTCLRRAYPEAQIAWAVEEASAGVLKRQPDLDDVIVFPRKKLARVVLHPSELAAARQALDAFFVSLKSARFDLVVDFQGTLKSAIMARLTGAPRLVGLSRGHAREMSHLLYTERVDLPGAKMNRVERALALVAHLGAGIQDATAQIPEEEEDAAYVDRFLRSLAPSAGGQDRPAVIFPGTSRTQAYKRYPPSHFARAADTLSERTGAPVVVAWGPGEMELAGEVISMMRRPATLSPPLSLGQLTALIRRARVFIAGDTGPMHIAWTIGTPVVAVYGPTDPVLNHPGGSFSAVAYEKVFCSPCRNRGCIARTCLEHLDPSRVVDAAISVIGRAESHASPGAGSGPTDQARLAADPGTPRFETMGPGSRSRTLDT